MKGSIKRYCLCIDPATGKEYGSRCPKSTTDSKHGEWEYRDRLPKTSNKAAPYRHRGEPTKKAAEAWREHVYALLALAKGDPQSPARVGDLIFAAKRGAELPAVEDVRRRLGLGVALDRSETVGEFLPAWLAGKRKLRESVARSYRQHMDHYLSPLLGEIPLDRLSPEHIADMLDLIEEWNAEIRLARKDGRRPVLELDKRQRSGIVGIATQRRIFATLRTALNAAWKARRIDQNPCNFVEMPAEHRDPANVWSPEQVVIFLDYCEATRDRLAVLFRLVLLHGLRRGEAVGARRARFDHRLRDLVIARPLLQLGGTITESTPKTRAGERLVVLDQVTADLVVRL
jgi:integrase